MSAQSFLNPVSIGSNKDIALSVPNGGVSIGKFLNIGGSINVSSSYKSADDSWYVIGKLQIPKRGISCRLHVSTSTNTGTGETDITINLTDKETVVTMQSISTASLQQAAVVCLDDTGLSFNVLARIEVNTQVSIISLSYWYIHNLFQCVFTQ